MKKVSVHHNIPFKYLQLIGTAAADYEGIEKSENENCIEAVRLGGRNLREPSSLFLFPNCIIDFSSRALSQMQRFNIDYNLIQYILITHPHRDHFSPLSIINMVSKAKNSPLIGGNSLTIKLLKKWEEENLNGHIVKTKLFIPFKEYRLGDIYVIPVEANHKVQLVETEVYLPKEFSTGELKENKNTVQTALNYIIRIKDQTILYACDTGLPVERTYQFFKLFKFDIVIHEATFESKEDSNHMNFRKITDVRSNMIGDGIITEKTPFILTHLSLNFTPVYDRIKEPFLKEGIIVGYDGMVVPL